jgi:hypothetical protein
MVRLPGYDGAIRQLAVDGLGREQPTLFVSNNLAETARSLIADLRGGKLTHSSRCMIAVFLLSGVCSC